MVVLTGYIPSNYHTNTWWCMCTSVKRFIADIGNDLATVLCDVSSSGATLILSRLDIKEQTPMNFDSKHLHFRPENAFVCIICRMSAVLFRRQYVRTMHIVVQAAGSTIIPITKPCYFSISWQISMAYLWDDFLHDLMCTLILGSIARQHMQLNATDRVTGCFIY